jgi:hypothetical protein
MQFSNLNLVTLRRLKEFGIRLSPERTWSPA